MWYFQKWNFNEIKRLLNKYYKNGDKIYLWGIGYTEKTKNEIDQWVNNRVGNEGSELNNISKILSICPNHREHLIIVSDALINNCDISKSEILMKQNNIKLKFVSVYLVGKYIDTSIGSPFYKNSPYRIIHIIDENTRINFPSSIEIDNSFFKIINNISSLFEFSDKYKELYCTLNGLGININDKMSQKIKEIYKKINKEFKEKWINIFKLAQIDIIIYFKFFLIY